MSNISQFIGSSRPPTSIVNATSTTGSTPDLYGAGAAATITSAVKVAYSGALTANTLATVLSLTGQGVVLLAGCGSVDATSRTHRFKLTIDGVVVYDATTTAAAAIYKGIVVIGTLVNNNGSYFIFGLDAVPFNSSFLLEYASSVSETAKTLFNYMYRMT